MSTDTLAEAHDALYDALNVMLTGDPGPVTTMSPTPAPSVASSPAARQSPMSLRGKRPCD